LVRLKGMGLRMRFLYRGEDGMGGSKSAIGFWGAGTASRLFGWV